MAAASEGFYSGTIFFDNVQAFISQAVLISSSSAAVIRKVQFYAVQLDPVHSLCSGPNGLFSPESSGVLLHAGVIGSRPRTRQAGKQLVKGFPSMGGFAGWARDPRAWLALKLDSTTIVAYV